MIQNCYSIYDRKALVYSPPFYAVNHGAAIRMVTDAVADPNTSLARHPADYVLYCVGAWDDAKGRLHAVDPLDHVIDVISTVSVSRQAELFKDSERTGQ